MSGNYNLWVNVNEWFYKKNYSYYQKIFNGKVNESYKDRLLSVKAVLEAYLKHNSIFQTRSHSDFCTGLIENIRKAEQDIKDLADHVIETTFKPTIEETKSMCIQQKLTYLFAQLAEHKSGVSFNPKGDFASSNSRRIATK